MGKPIKNIGLIAKQYNEEFVRAAEGITEWFSKRGVGVHAEERFRGKVKGAASITREEMPGVVDLVVVLGGDGTMLYAARLVGGTDIPLMGINLGSLGFMAAVDTVEDVYPHLERIIKGEFETEERMMLSVTIERDGKSSSYDAFNDVIIKGSHARLVRMGVRIDKNYVTTYRADGLIVATPTGSTAYALSAAGPIVYPTIHSIIVVPICPFNLTNRPVIIPDWMNVEVSLVSEQRGVELTLDGQVEMGLEKGDVLDIKRSAKNVHLVKCGDKGYFDILRERLMWEGVTRK
ncbi:MAG: NAD(+)/NADH kinase [Thermodesulfobacteriota bacterium]